MTRLHLILLILLLAGSVLSGCAAKRTVPPSRIVRVAVLDGLVNYPVAQTGEIRPEGWWWGARDKYLSPNTAILAADIMAHELNKEPGVEVSSRDDYRLFLAQKERRLKRAYPLLTPEQRRELLLQQSPVDYGRALNVDYVIRPVISEAWTFTNRTIAIWKSRVDMQVEIYKVTPEAEKPFFIWQREDADYFHSQLSVVEQHTKKLRREISELDLFGVFGPGVR